MHGATPLVLFTGIMNADKYIEILKHGLLPFTDAKFPDKKYRFQQDNDPKHVSRVAQEFFNQNGINWLKTPPESPDLNPIENVWGYLKYFLRNNYKPTNLESLEAGIVEFWQKMTQETSLSPDTRYKYGSIYQAVESTAQDSVESGD